jgi:type I restriction enzyme S subunit
MISEWQDLTFGDFVSIQRGHDLPDQDRRKGLVPILGSFGITGYHDTAKTKGPGVTIGRSGASFGVAAYSEIDYWPLNTALYVTDFKGNDPKFVFYFMKSFDFSSYNSGSAQPSLNRNNLYPTLVKIPQSSEQKQIASILTALDNRITLLRENNITLEAIAQALFKSWFVDFDPVRAKQEGLEPEGMDADTVALFPDSFEESELGLVPKGWTISAVYDLAQYINGAAYKAFEPNSECIGLPIIKIAELKAGVTSQTGYSEVKMPLKYLISTKDILFSWSGNPDTSIDTFVWPHGEAWLNQHIFRVVPKSDQERSFILLTLKYLKPVFAEIARDKQTTGLGHVTVSDLKRLQVVQPNKQLLERWNELVDPLLERAFFVEQKAQTLATLRDTLLPRLISGQLRLPDADALVGDV